MPNYQKHYHSLIQIFLIIITCITSCKQKDITEIGSVISEIKIEAKNNTAILSNDLVGVIEGSNITFNVPKGIELKDVLISLNFEGEGVYINNVKIDVAGVKISIANATVITLKSVKGVIKNYKVIFIETDDAQLVLNAIKLEKKNNPWLTEDYIFEVKENSIVGNISKFYTNVIPTFSTNAQSVEISNEKQVSGRNIIDLKQNISYTLNSSKGFKKQFQLIINWKNDFPQINITTNSGTKISSKTTYIPGNISIDGKGVFNNYKGNMEIRGRGNSTWDYPKKPYRIKLDAKASLFGLAADKDWVLLANYLDGTHTLNAVAMKAGSLLNIPYVNHIIPVEVTINGEFLGTYMFTEQVEIDANRVNIGADGLLLEFDKYFNEAWQFQSSFSKLPVIIKHPELLNSTEIIPIKNEFEKLEALVMNSNFPNNNYLDYIDEESIVNFFIVNMLADNQEINHPKSIFMHKAKTGKFAMGPLWDFDWAYSFNGNSTYFSSANNSFFWRTPSVGTNFFSTFLKDPKIKTLLKTKWSDFRKNNFNDLLTYVNDYTFIIEDARNRDYQKWKRGGFDFKSDINSLKNWLQNRANYLDGYIGGL